MRNPHANEKSIFKQLLLPNSCFYNARETTERGEDAAEASFYIRFQSWTCRAVPHKPFPAALHQGDKCCHSTTRSFGTDKNQLWAPLTGKVRLVWEQGEIKATEQLIPVPELAFLPGIDSTAETPKLFNIYNQHAKTQWKPWCFCKENFILPDHVWCVIDWGASQRHLCSLTGNAALVLPQGRISYLHLKFLSQIPQYSGLPSLL